MKAAIYSRKSKFTGKGESVENQIQLCKEHAMKFLEIKETDIKIYEDEGFSGRNMNRPNFQKLLKDAKRREFDLLICYRLDRISRNITDFTNLIKDLNKYNVDFISIREQFDTTTPMGRAMMYIASVFSQLERETIAERIRDNMLQLAKTGRWLGGTTPTGYKSEPVVSIDLSGKERKMYKLSPILEEINLVKIIYDKFLELKSLTKVEKYLIENRYTTKNGGDFQRYAIKFILNNPVYSIADRELFTYLNENNYELCSNIDEFNGINGLMAYNKTKQDNDNSSERIRDNSEWIIAVGLHNGIILGENWIKAQELLLLNKTKAYRQVKNSQSLLSGILRCSKCGSFMRPKMGRVNAAGEKIFYYMCEMKEKSRKTRCEVENIQGNILDKLVIIELKKIAKCNSLLFEDFIDEKLLIEPRIDPIKNNTDAMKNRIIEIDLSLQNLVSSIAKGQKDEISEMIKKNMKELIDEKKEVAKKLNEKENVDIKLNEINLDIVSKNLSKLNDYSISIMEVENKRKMIKSIVDKILWDGEKINIMLFESI
jgi:site-specific DNA recombinase